MLMIIYNQTTLIGVEQWSNRFATKIAQIEATHTHSSSQICIYDQAGLREREEGLARIYYVAPATSSPVFLFYCEIAFRKR